MNMKTKSLLILLLVLGLIVLGYFLIPKLFKSSEPVENSIAVLPFKDISSNPENTYLIDGIMEEILNNLTTI